MQSDARRGGYVPISSGPGPGSPPPSGPRRPMTFRLEVEIEATSLDEALDAAKQICAGHRLVSLYRVGLGGPSK